MSQSPAAAARETPTLRYRRPPADDPAEESEPGIPAPMGTVRAVLTWAILLACLAIWAVVGAVLWLPLVLRTIVVFSVALVRSTLDGEAPTEAARRLRGTVDFYLRGFRVAMDTVLEREVDEDGGRATSPRHARHRGSLLGEVAWAVVVWYALFLLVGVVEFGPVDAWNAVAGLDWGGWMEWVLGGGEGAGATSGAAVPDTLSPEAAAPR